MAARRSSRRPSDVRAAAASLQTQESAISAQVPAYQARVSELEQRLAAEQAAPSTSPGDTPGGPRRRRTAAGERLRLAPDLSR